MTEVRIQQSKVRINPSNPPAAMISVDTNQRVKFWSWKSSRLPRFMACTARSMR